jgi:hypothetical protein
MSNSTYFQETPEQTMDHLQFQMSLLRLTALPGQSITAGEAIPETAGATLLVRKQASMADLALEELALVANGRQ